VFDQLCPLDLATPVSVEVLEGLRDLFIVLAILLVVQHGRQELCLLHGSVVVDVHGTEDLVDLFSAGLAQLLETVHHLVLAQHSVTIHVHHVESAFEGFQFNFIRHHG